MARPPREAEERTAASASPGATTGRARVARVEATGSARIGTGTRVRNRPARGVAIARRTGVPGSPSGRGSRASATTIDHGVRSVTTVDQQAVTTATSSVTTEPPRVRGVTEVPAPEPMSVRPGVRTAAVAPAGTLVPAVHERAATTGRERAATTGRGRATAATGRPATGVRVPVSTRGNGTTVRRPDAASARARTEPQVMIGRAGTGGSARGRTGDRATSVGRETIASGRRRVQDWRPSRTSRPRRRAWT